jgi:hypothetical protein
MKKHRTFWYALWSQACLLCGILICLVIRSKQAELNYPVSYFGNFRDTILPYAAGFLLCTYWLIRTVRALPQEMHAIRVLLSLVATCSLGVLCTPYMTSHLVGWIHLSFAISLLMLEIALSVLLIIRSHNPFAVVGFAVQLIGGVFAALSQTGRVHIELMSELAVIVGFGILFSHNLSKLEEAKTPEQG